jgi:hypothetical protein
MTTGAGLAVPIVPRRCRRCGSAETHPVVILIFFKGIAMSEATTPAPAKPARSPVERAIVWGVIGLGVLVIAVEANAHLSHGAALAKLQAQLDENMNKESGMRKSHVDQIVGSKIPDVQKLNFLDTSMAASRVDIYTYPALLRSRKLYIYYGIDGKKPGQEAEVMEVLTSVAPTAAEVHPRLEQDTDGKSGGHGSGTGGGRGAGRGKRQQPEGDQIEGHPAIDAAKPAEETKPAEEAKSDEAQTDEQKPVDSKPEADKPAAPKAEEDKLAEAEPKKE